MKDLINKRKIIGIRPDKELIVKEIKASEYDLESALEIRLTIIKLTIVDYINKP